MKCKICEVNFNNINRLPIVLLVCGHTFCRECILKFKLWLCPLCRSNICGTQKNFLIMDEINNEKKKKLVQNKISMKKSFLYETKLK